MESARPQARHLAATLAAVLLMVLAFASRAHAAPGDVYLADNEAGAGGHGAIFKIGPGGGTPTLLTDDPQVDGANGMVLDPATGLLLVANFTNTIHTVDPNTGAVGTYVAGPASAGYADLVFGADGKLYATDGNAKSVVRIDPATKAIATVASGFFQPFSDYPDGIAATRKGKLYVSDENSAVYEIDPATGAARVFAHSPVLGGADGMAFSPDEGFLYVAGFCMPVLDCGSSTGPPNQLAKIDMATGAASIVASLSDAVAVSVRTDGTLLVSNTQDDVLQTVPASGSPVGSFTTMGLPLRYPHDTVTEPDLCAGKIPTVIGTTGPDSLVGSPFADVISTLGGKDTVTGGGGNDIICGGPGKDKLFGQGGRDKLLGQGGKDRLVGGKKKDVDKGGAGSDTCVGKGDKLRSC
jgi:Ca2+-binding RTX toxin-like protein